MNKYAQTAIRAAHYMQSGFNANNAWEKASCEIFVPGSYSQKKGCPRKAFLGLFGGSGKNAKYAQKALAYLKEHGMNGITTAELWKIAVNGEAKIHNSQMEVVLALFREGLI